METINIQLQVATTGKYTLDEFVAKIKDYADKLSNTISKPTKSYQEAYMTPAEQEAYVSESLNRALDQMEEHKKNGTKPMDAREFLRKLREEDQYGSKDKCRKGVTYNHYQEEDVIVIDLLTIYDKNEISNISDDFITYLLNERENI